MAGRRTRPAETRRSQHFLADADVAEAIAACAALTRRDLVVEFGAGDGRLTERLATRVGQVVAVELDTRLAARLAHRLHGRPNVTVVQGDALAVPLPGRPFRVVSNPPFHLTADLLHRLLDDRRVPLERADLVVGWGAALALTGVFGPAHKARAWASRYEFLLVRRLPPAVFSPEPSQPAALISIRSLRSAVTPSVDRLWSSRDQAVVDATGDAPARRGTR